MSEDRTKGKGKTAEGTCRKRELGIRGEELAAGYLRRRGFRIVEINVRSRFGEIDLVATEGETVVIVEVKSKGGRTHGSPEDMVTISKQRKLTVLAAAYLRRRHWSERPARFDVVAVDWDGEGKEEIRHYRDAFPAVAEWC